MEIFRLGIKPYRFYHTYKNIFSMDANFYPTLPPEGYFFHGIDSKYNGYLGHVTQIARTKLSSLTKGIRLCLVKRSEYVLKTGDGQAPILYKLTVSLTYQVILKGILFIYIFIFKLKFCKHLDVQ